MPADLPLGTRNAPTPVCRGFSLLDSWLQTTSESQDMSGCQPGHPRTGANLRDGENLQAVECHLDHAPTNVPPPTFDLHELRQMIFQLVWLADIALARCVDPYLSSLPRFLDCLALPRDQGQRFPPSLTNYFAGFAAALWIPRLALRAHRLPRVGGTRFQSSPVLLGSVITLSD